MSSMLKTLGAKYGFLLFCTYFCLILLGLVQGEYSSSKTSAFKAKFVQTSKYCSRNHNASLVETIPMFARNEDPGKKQTACYFYCMLERYQMMDKSGAYHIDKIEKFIDSVPDSNFKTSLKANKDKCLKEDTQNVCQKAYKFCKCFYRNGVIKKPEK